jgi:integrase
VSNEKGKIGFLYYFEKLSNERREKSEGNYANWFSTLKHLKIYCNGYDHALENIDSLFLEGFKDHLLKTTEARGNTKLHNNTASSYFNKVRAALREAYVKKMIKENPCQRVKSIKAADTHRQFLTFEELQKLVATPCENEPMKKAFLFSALTGLRWSDVKGLSWENVKHSEKEGWSIHFTQKKTSKSEILPVSDQAIRLLGNKTQGTEKIFFNLKYHTWMNTQLQNWVRDAGINKKITFHCARHSFATLQLSLETDIYTVSKLLGHRNLKTTEIYAKVIDKKKVDAAKRIPSLINE